MATKRARPPQPRPKPVVYRCPKCGGKDWRVVTTIESVPGERFEFGSYVICDYARPDREIHCADCGAHGPVSSYITTREES